MQGSARVRARCGRVSVACAYAAQLLLSGAALALGGKQDVLILWMCHVVDVCRCRSGAVLRLMALVHRDVQESLVVHLLPHGANLI